MATTTSLEAEFLQDHRALTEGLRALRDALETGRIVRARKVAADLDRDAGSHIEFEEKYFYPWLVPILGESFVRQLYREHDAGQNAIREILSQHEQRIDDTRVLPLIGDIEIAVDHALSCGTLTSHLAGLSDAEREEMLTHLHECRARGVLWTSIDPADRPLR